MKQLSKTLVHILTISLLVFLLPLSTVTAATPTHIYEWMSQSGTISPDGEAHEYTNLEAGQTLNLSLTLINRSDITIKAKSNLPSSPNLQVPVGSYGIGSQTPVQDGTPYFLDTSSFVLNNNRFTYYEGSDVLPNEAIVMSWNIKLANNLSDGVYNLHVRPVSEYLAWTRQIKTGKLLPTTSSDIFWRLTVGEGEQEEYLTYNNQEYGFSFSLPASWEGYSIVNSQWEGFLLHVPGTNIIEGPQISIQHPLWASENPRQDIPIMIFTTDQWSLIVQEKLSVGAAPIPPSKLSQNSSYIFALPARYNYAFPVGWQEVDEILQDSPLQAF